MGSLIIDVIIDSVESISEEEEFASFSEILKEESYQNEIRIEATQAYNEAIASSQTEDIANEEAVDSSYTKLNQLDTDLANQWRFKVEQEAEKKGIIINSSEENPGTGQSYEDTSAEADPDQADIDEDSVQEKTADCKANPLGEACIQAKESNFEKFMKYLRDNIPTIVIVIYFVLKDAVGAVATAWCKLFNCGDCKKVGNNCQSSCQQFNCDCSKKCETKTCDTIKTFIQGFRKYFWLIIVVSILISILLLFWLKSLTLFIILLIINTIIILLKGQFGNFVATTICNETAADCWFKTGKVRC